MKVKKQLSLLGTKLKSMDLETRILFMALIAGGIISFVSVFLNILLDLSVLAILTPLFMAGGYVWLIYSVYHNPDNNIAGYIAIIMSTFLIFPSIWFNSGGLTGSTPYFYLFMVFLTTVVLRKLKFRVVLLIQFLVAVTLVMIEIIAPDSVAPYSSYQAHFLDNFFAFAIITVFVATMTIYIMDNYHRSIEALESAKNDLEKANKNLELIATTDELTHLYNRRYAMTKLSEAIAAVSLGHSEGFGVLMLDIDHFKSINDTFGHTTGDIVLKELSQVLIDFCDGDHTPTRIGGEEFLILCYTDPNEKIEVANETFMPQAFSEMAKAIKAAIDQADWPVIHPDLNVTVSLGAYWVDLDNGTRNVDLEHILSSVDHALYDAKNAGRNRICYYRERP